MSVKIAPMEREQRRWMIAEELTAQFIERRDLQAIQLDDGRYVCIKKPSTAAVMYRHLEGTLTLGAYLLDQESMTRQIVLDADDDEQLEQLKRMAWSLDAQDIPAYLETSRRGGHLRLFFPERISGQKARRFGLKLLKDHHLKMELYPKQEMVKDGPGSLVRVPFGKHRLTGIRYGFINPDGSELAPLAKQVELLAHPHTVPLPFIEANQLEPERKPVYPRPGTGETVWERIKTSVTVHEFVSQYVELKPTGNGFVGKCPFHDDQKPSFGVNTRDNYWNCFAGCGGGSIIDFWMTYQGIDFKTAVTELEDMLLGGTHE